MLNIIGVIFFVAVFMFLYGILIALNRYNITIEKRMNQITEMQKDSKGKDEDRSFLERILRPIYHSFSQFLLKATPNHKITILNKKLERAGLLKSGSKEKWLYTKSMLILISSTLIGLLSYNIDPNPLKAIFISMLIVLLTNYVFNFYLSRKIQIRKCKILRDLPYTLDLITVSVEAGLSFDGAMARVVSNIEGELCYEFSKSLKEIRMGIERKIALKNMSNRCEVNELSTFVNSIIQADELGVSLGKVLRIESENLREHRKQVAREKAMKAPIKMLFPLIFFIFPTVFIVILGPVIIKMVDVFGGN